MARFPSLRPVGPPERICIGGATCFFRTMCDFPFVFHMVIDFCSLRGDRRVRTVATCDLRHRPKHARARITALRLELPPDASTTLANEAMCRGAFVTPRATSISGEDRHESRVEVFDSRGASCPPSGTRHWTFTSGSMSKSRRDQSSSVSTKPAAAHPVEVVHCVEAGSQFDHANGANHWDPTHA